MRLRNIPEAKEIVAKSAFTYVPPFEDPVTVQEMFPEKHPLAVEIGMGKGTFLMEMGRRHPEINYLGVERYETVLMRAVQKIEAMEESPDNVRFLCADAEVLTEICPKESVEVLYLNFSDPWPKARHAKRRLTSSHFLHVYEGFLKRGARLEFKTDNTALFDFSLETLEGEAHWKLRSVTRDLHRTLAEGEENVMTEYERKFSLLGNKICRLTAEYLGEGGLTESTQVG